MNYIYWPPVVNAKRYTLFIHEDDVCIRTQQFEHTDPLYYVDTQIKDNVQYSYLIEVEYEDYFISGNNSSNTGVNVNNKTMSDKVSVTAIVPNSNLSALELVEYESPFGNTDFIVNSRNIDIAKHNKDKISISFPSKAYLNYDLTLTLDNEYETLKEFYTLENLKDNAKNDTTLYASFLVSQAGTYKARIVAKAENDHFGDSNVITSEKSVTISKLSGSTEGIIYASYKGADKIRIIFDEFILQNGSPAPKSYYKLYRSEKGSKNYTLVEGNIETTGEISKNFYVDDYINDNTKIYEYTLVITDGTLYSANSSKKTVAAYTIDSQTTPQIYGEQILDYIDWEIKLPSNNVNLIRAYIFEKPSSDTAVVIPDDFYTNGIIAEVYKETETLYKCRTYGNTIGNKVYMLVITEEDNKILGEWISNGVTRNKDKRNAIFYDENGSLIETKNVVENPYDSSWNQVQLPYISGKDGYIINGWRNYYDNNLLQPYDFVSLTSSSTAFYAEYIRVANFYDAYGNFIETKTVVTEPYNSSWNQIQLPSISEKDGYIINGWRNYYDNNLLQPYDYVSLSTSTTDFYTEYVRVAKFYDENGSLIETKTVVENPYNGSWNQIQLPSIPEKNGYISNWHSYYDYNLYSPDDVVYLSTSSTDFYVKYYETRIANFYDEYGNFIKTITTIEDPNNSSWYKIQLPSISEKDGYIINGWRNDYNNLYSPNEYVYLSSLTTNFYTEYKEKEIRMAYFYDDNGNLIDTKTVIEDPNNSSWYQIQLPSISEKDGYIINGWRNDYDNSLLSPNNDVCLYSSTTNFYPEYHEKELRIANFYDADGNFIETITTIEDPNNSSWYKIQLPSISEKDGYIINGWRNDYNNLYSPNDYVSLSTSTTNFYAKYITEGYTIDSISLNESVKTYALYCEQGSSYSVSWMDSYQGNSELNSLMQSVGITGNTVDIKVSVFSETGSPIISSVDSGYTDPQIFTANETGYYTIQVEPYSSGSTGYFAIKFEQL